MAQGSLLAERHSPELLAVLGSVSQEGTGKTRRLEKGGKINSENGRLRNCTSL